MKITRNAALIALVCSAGSTAYAERIQTPLPTVGQVTTYSIKGGGDAAVMMDGADSGLPMAVETNAAIRRKIVSAAPDGTLTADETVVRHDFTVNDQPVQLPVPPRATVITDPTGKVQQVLVDGRPAGLPMGIGDLQSVLALWQLPNKDYTPGQSWNQVVPLAAAAAAGTSSTLSFAETYTGLKQVNGRSVMQFTSHLSAPVNIKPQGPHSMGGFTVTSMTLNSVDQQSSYDPANGLLLDAKTSLKMDVNVTMGHDAGAAAMVVRVPLALVTHLDKLETETASPAPPTSAPTTPAPNTPAPNASAPGTPAPPSPPVKAPDAGGTTTASTKAP